MRACAISSLMLVVAVVGLPSSSALNSDLLHASIRQGLGESGGLVHTFRELRGKLKPTLSAAASKGNTALATEVQPAWYVPMVAGALATAVGDICLHPVDTIKTVQQSVAQSASAAVEKGGTTVLGAIRSILAKNGPLGFYAGAAPYVTLDGLSGCIKFAAYEACNRWAKENLREEHQTAAKFASAGIAFMACSVILVPGELLKQQLQSSMQPGLRAAASQIWRTGGPLGFFQGYKATVVRDVPYTMMELGLYDVVKCSLGNELVAAALVGGFIGYVTNPLDIVKTRMMTAASGQGPGFLRVVKDIWVQEGPRQFMCGAMARVTWLMPFTAIYLPTYDLATRWLVRRQQSTSATGKVRV